MRERLLPGYMKSIDVSMFMDEFGIVEHSCYPSNENGKIDLYKIGDPEKEKVVFIPPYGMPSLLMLKLAKELASRFYILCWESRGVPNHLMGVSDEDICIDVQASDFVSIVKAENFNGAHIVGWCQAAQLIVYLLGKELITTKSLCCIAPAGLGESLVQSEYDRCALPVYLEIEKKGIDYAERFMGMLDKYREEDFRPEIAVEKYSVLHLSSAESTYIFSKYMRLYAENVGVVNKLLSRSFAGLKVLFTHCKDDSYSHYSESVCVSRKYPSVSLRLFDEGGHHQLFHSAPTLAKVIIDFVDSGLTE